MAFGSSPGVPRSGVGALGGLRPSPATQERATTNSASATGAFGRHRAQARDVRDGARATVELRAQACGDRALCGQGEPELLPIVRAREEFCAGNARFGALPWQTPRVPCSMASCRASKKRRGASLGSQGWLLCSVAAAGWAMSQRRPGLSRQRRAPRRRRRRRALGRLRRQHSHRRHRRRRRPRPPLHFCPQRRIPKRNPSALASRVRSRMC